MGKFPPGKVGPPSVQKSYPVLPGWKVLHVISDVIYEEFIMLLEVRQNGTEFHSG